MTTKQRLIQRLKQVNIIIEISGDNLSIDDKGRLTDYAQGISCKPYDILARFKKITNLLDQLS